MKKNFFFILTLLLPLLLTSCLVPEFEAPEQEKVIEKQENVEKLEILDEIELPTRTVTYEDAGKQSYYGYDDNNNLVYIKNDNEWTLLYENKTLKKIIGPKTYVFEYNENGLSKIENEKTTPFFYDETGKLLEMQDKENVHFSYSGERISAVTRGVAGRTAITYDDKNRTQTITKGSITTLTRYDDKNRLRLLDGGDIHLVLGYWRDNKLIKITGNTLGEGIEVSYGPETKPTKATIIKEGTEPKFSSPETEILYNTVDLYLYCNYVRRLPVIWDGISYTVFREYYKEDIQDYFVKNIICELI